MTSGVIAARKDSEQSSKVTLEKVEFITDCGDEIGRHQTFTESYKYSNKKNGNVTTSLDHVFKFSNFLPLRGLYLFAIDIE